MGSGLKPSFKASCPKCNFVLKYYVRDSQAHPDSWVLNSDSLHHLKEAHIVVPKCGRRISSDLSANYHHPGGALSCEAVPIVLKGKRENA